MDEHEIVFTISSLDEVASVAQTGEIRRLSAGDSAVFNRHLSLCRQALASVSEQAWRKWNAEGTEFYMLFVDGVPVARCSIEKYSNQAWEAADVRTVKEYRRQGHARSITAHVTKLILQQGKTATCRTLSGNIGMLKVLEAVGYKKQ